MTLIERYRAGEYEAVWTELRAMKVRPAPEEIADIAAVVAETMQRVKGNLERIAAGLKSIGYTFQAVEVQKPGLSAAMQMGAAAMAGAEALLASLEGRNDAQAQHIREMLGMGTASFANARDAANGVEAHGSDPDQPHMIFMHPTQAHAEEIRRFEQEIGRLPLALTGFWQQIGGVDFTGSMPSWSYNCSDWDPLVIWPPEQIADACAGCGEKEPCEIDLMPDFAMKGGFSGATVAVHIPTEDVVDFRLETGEWFIDYLRRATRAGGCPGFMPAGSTPFLPPDIRPIADAWEAF